MGRWKPPPPKSSAYITPQGFAALQQELEEIWVRRRGVVKALAAAAAEGDRSENAEYIYRKKELGSIDYRIRYLQKRLPDLTVVAQHTRRDAIYFGATVTLIDDAGQQISYRIVGPDEANAKTAAISMDAPLARALLAKSVGDNASVTTSEGIANYTIEAIHYSGG